jgi:nucleoside phosphorylase
MANRRAEVLILTVNPHETTALAEALSAVSGHPHNPATINKRVYNDFGLINGARVFHVLSEMGTGGRGGAQRTVDEAIRALKPLAVIAVGIAFGVNQKKQSIGDILISSRLWLYDLQRVGKDIVPRGDKPHASTWLINYFESFNQFKWEGAKARTGLLLTGDKLVDNIDYRSQLLKLEGEAIGGEMEGAGVYVSSEESKVDWIVVKAICDWADGKKGYRKEQRQSKAAANAATFVAQALSSFRLIEEAGSTKRKRASKAKTVDEHESLRRESDKQTLSELFSLLPRPLVTHFLDQANQDRFVYDILTELEPAEDYVKSATFHLYDQTLASLVRGFFTHWFQIQDESRGLFDDQLGTGVAQRVHWSRQPPDFDARYARYHDHVVEAHKAFRDLNTYVREKFPDINLNESDRTGVARYVEWMERIKKEVAELRESLKKEKREENAARTATEASENVEEAE